MRIRGAVAAAFLLLASGARADDLDEFGFGARASAMGGAMTALSSDWTSTYYNPAGLILSRHVNVGFGFQYADYKLDFKSAKGGSQVDAATNRVTALSAFTMGASSAIPIDVPDRIALGIGLLFPTRNIVSIDETAPTSQPEWILFGNHEDRIQILPAVAVKIIDGLSVGGGVTIFSTSEGGTVSNVGPPLQTSFTLKLRPDVGGLVGIYYQPVEWISFGLCYRTERSFKLVFNADVQVLGLSTPIQLQALDFFTPHQVSIGTAIDLPMGMILCFDFTYLNYSAYREPFIVATSPALPVPQNVHSNFHDTVIPRIGFEWTPFEWLALRAGYFWRMSPVGNQANKTFNLVDSDEHVVTLGVGFEYKSSAEPAPAAAEGKAPEAAAPKKSLFGEGAVGVDLFFQAHVFSGTSVTKSDPNDPVGGYDAGGAIFNFGFNLYGRF